MNAEDDNTLFDAIFNPFQFEAVVLMTLRLLFFLKHEMKLVCDLRIQRGNYPEAE
jgi:hypothetical protein